MMNTKPYSQQGNWRTGTVSVALMIVLVMVAAMVVSIVMATSRANELSGLGVAGTRAQYAGDAGTQMALREIVGNSDYDADGTIGSVGAGSTGRVLSSSGGASTLAGVVSSGSTRTVTVTSLTGEARRKQVVALTRQSTGLVRGFYAQDWDASTSLSSTTGNNYNSTPTFAGVVPQLNLVNVTSRPRWNGHAGTRFYMRWLAKLAVPGTGTYTFSLTSDDGSVLRINGVTVVDHDGVHSASTKTGTVALSQGSADLDVRFFDNTGSSACSLQWSGPGITGTRFVLDTDVTCTPFESMPPFAINGAVSIGANSIVDSFDSGAGVYGGTNVRTSDVVLSTNSSASGAVTIGSGTIFSGSAVAAPGAAANSVISGTITGTKSNLASRIAIPEFSFQGTIPASSDSGNVPANTVNTVSSNSRWSAINFQTNGVLNISGDLTIFVNGNLNFSTGSKLIVPVGSRITWVVDGNITVNGLGVEINKAGTNDRCRFILTALNGGGKSFSTSVTGTLISADIWAPWSAVSLFGGTVFSGSIRANALTTGTSCVLHADAAAGSTGATSTRMNSWGVAPP